MTTGVDVLLPIGTYVFKLKLTNAKNDSRLENLEGLTNYRERQILVRDDLDDLTTMCMVRHELVHAILYTQGRTFYDSYDEELMADFVAMNFDLIDKLSKIVMKTLNINYNYLDKEE